MTLSYILQQRELAKMRNYAENKNPNAVQPSSRPMDGFYVPPIWNVREGADDHKAHVSLGLSAQIKPR